MSKQEVLETLVALLAIGMLILLIAMTVPELFAKILGYVKSVWNRV